MSQHPKEQVVVRPPVPQTTVNPPPDSTFLRIEFIDARRYQVSLLNVQKAPGDMAALGALLDSMASHIDRDRILIIGPKTIDDTVFKGVLKVLAGRGYSSFKFAPK